MIKCKWDHLTQTGILCYIFFFTHKKKIIQTCRKLFWPCMQTCQPLRILRNHYAFRVSNTPVRKPVKKVEKLRILRNFTDIKCFLFYSLTTLFIQYEKSGKWIKEKTFNVCFFTEDWGWGVGGWGCPVGPWKNLLKCYQLLKMEDPWQLSMTCQT